MDEKKYGDGSTAKPLKVVYDAQDLKNVIGFEIKDDAEALVTLMNEFNGAYDSAQAGVGAAYIPTSAYFHVVTEGEGEEEHVSDDPKVEIVELYYNWKALGKNKAAIYGAAIRFASRHLVSMKREVITHKEAKIGAEEKADFANFRAQLQHEKFNAAIWAKQFPSILAMNGSCLIAISHHWDSENSKPWDAIVSSLGQGDNVESNMYRTMFYLALHPIPLNTVEHFRAKAAEGKDTTYLNAVSVRARCTPATTGALIVAASAINDFKSEPFMKDCKGVLLEKITALEAEAKAIRSSPANYCPLAVTFGKERKVADVSAFKLPMIVLTAYIYESVKGSLAKSQSLKKFSSANSRVVVRWRNLFAKEVDEEAGTLKDEFAKYIQEVNEDEQ
jgi:hypothetical protein